MNGFQKIAAGYILFSIFATLCGALGVVAMASLDWLDQRQKEKTRER